VLVEVVMMFYHDLFCHVLLTKINQFNRNLYEKFKKKIKSIRTIIFLKKGLKFWYINRKGVLIKSIGKASSCDVFGPKLMRKYTPICWFFILTKKGKVFEWIFSQNLRKFCKNFSIFSIFQNFSQICIKNRFW
jgi:hypothetical protein